MKKLCWLFLFLAVGGIALAVPPAAPLFELTLLPSVYDVPVDGPLAFGKLLIKNGGNGGKMTWAIQEVVPKSWLSLSATASTPQTEIQPNATHEVDITIDVTGLPAQNDTCELKVTGNGTNSGLSVFVTLHVNATPKIEVTPPGKIIFDAPQGGPNPSAKNFTIRNSGGGDLIWTATLNPSSSWLKMNKAGGTLGPSLSEPFNVSAEVVSTGLAAGFYTGTITFAAPGATTLVVNVELTVRLNPSIDVQPATLTFDTPVGSNPAAKEFTVKNVGGGTLKWVAEESQTWMNLSPIPTQGNLIGGASAKVTVSIDTNGLVEGTYQADITVREDVDSIPRQKVTVTLNVNAGPKIGVNPESLEFTVAEDSGGSAPDPVSITNIGNLPLAWSLTGGAAWVKTSKTGGSLNPLQSEPLQISVNPKGLAPNVYTTTVLIEGVNASNSPKTIAIQMTVNPSSLPTTAPAGQCGLLGLELVAAILLLRTLKSRGGLR
jgi:hypothetical protein